MTAARAVFLDRDGVINKALVRDGKPYPPAGPEETVIVEDAATSLAKLRAVGFLLLVVTNQPDVARGLVSRESVEAIHRFLKSELPIDDFYTCFHDDSDGCDCRKPLPGLLFQAGLRYGVDLEQSYLIGDRWRDIEAGAAAGCRTILIDYQYRERSSKNEPDARSNSLAEAVDWIVEQEARIGE